MKIQILSDLHLEFRGKYPTISTKADIIVVAGDLAASTPATGTFWAWVRTKTDVPILYVLGNHEFYGHCWPDIIDNYRRVAEDHRITVLENDTFIYNGIYFLGTTLWTDLDSGKCIPAAINSMNDFYYIRKKKGKFQVQDWLNAHKQAVGWLEDELTKQKHSTKVVITHHGPSFYLVSEMFKGDVLNGAFFAQLDNLILHANPDLWLYGHSHCFCDKEIGSTRCIANPRGYPYEDTTGFKDPFLIEV